MTGTDREELSSVPNRWVEPAPHLFVVLQGDRPYAGGLRCALRRTSEVALGRGETLAASRTAGGRRLNLALPDRKVSSRHARVIREGDGFWIHDEGSTNGTFVNAQRVTQQRLQDGDFIEVGQTILRVRFELPTPEETTEDAVAETPLTGVATLLPAHARELALVARVAVSKVPILLLGETGTGKEVLARAISATSKRPGPFVAVNCAALPDALVEAQLFGHTKGAFSGAMRDELGFVRAADQGTLFLDEIGDLPPAAQGALLRFLQEGEVVPVGSTRSASVDVRIVAATHQPIDAMIERGMFRRDLFARLHGFTHHAWPLATRKEDVGVLVADLLQRLCAGREETVRIARDAVRSLASYAWPLNVRELVQALSRALSLAEGGVIHIDHLPPALATIPRSSSAPPYPGEPLTADEAALRAEILRELDRHKGNVAAVARRMHKAPMQVYRWMRKLGIDPRPFR